MNLLIVAFLVVALVLVAAAVWTFAIRNWLSVAQRPEHRAKRAVLAAVETVLGTGLLAVLGVFWYVFTE
jgi:hypothetical protein